MCQQVLVLKNQVERLAAMVRLTDKVKLKTNQLRGIIDEKAGNTTEHNIQQFRLLQGFLQLDFQNEAEAIQRFLKKMAGNIVPVSPECHHLEDTYLTQITQPQPFVIKLWNTLLSNGCFFRLGIILEQSEDMASC
jgi:hypothetical protein